MSRAVIEDANPPGPPPQAIVRTSWWRRLLGRLRRDRLQALNVCRNGHVIPEPSNTWCESCDSSRALTRGRHHEHWTETWIGRVHRSRSLKP